jgi:putative Mg2+ transporter-C (MgtC) family protein
MNMILEELIGGFPDGHGIARVIIRLVIAMLLGAVVGVQRERTGKPAGVRTHMLVAMGSALFVLAPMEFGMNADGLSRVIQGLVTGIGFLGAGAILKLSEEREIAGLTTAAGIWMTAAIGLAVGLGRLGLAIVSMILTWITLSLVRKLEQRMELK